MVDSAIALLGTDSKVQEQIKLHAGPVTAILEDGWLRWIKVGESEALRAVAFLIRDSSWSTANPEISNLDVQQRKDGFNVTFDAHCRTKDGEIDWKGTIEGDAKGTIRFGGVASPAKDFTTCRTGFVVLHPLEGVVGCPVKVGFVDGRSEDAQFPELIDPYQSFKNIRSLSHEVLPGVWTTCVMEGDAWEMEDHRNWTDASFKTYVRLLEWGFPYVIKAGEEVRQQVSLVLSDAPPATAKAASAEGEPVVLSLKEGDGGRMPGIGVSLPSRRLDEARSVAERMRAIAPAFLHCRIVSAKGSTGLLARYRDIAATIGSPIALEVIVSDGNNPEGELTEAAKALDTAQVSPAAIIAVPAKDLIQIDPTDDADEPAIARIPQAARSVFPDIPLGGGVFGFFTEFNRNTPPMEPLDFVNHLTSALVHHADDASVMETISAVGAVVNSTRSLSNGKPHWLGPANIAMDDNPYGPSTPNPDNGRYTMARLDPRQRGVFGAAWTLGYIAEAARAGVDQLIMAAPAGEIGLIYCKMDYPQPYFDDLGREAVYPLYHVVRSAVQAVGRQRLNISSSAPQRVIPLCYESGNGVVLWLGNLTPRPQTVTLPPELGEKPRIRMLDEASFADATLDPDFFDHDDDTVRDPAISLAPYAVARVRTGG